LFFQVSPWVTAANLGTAALRQKRPLTSLIFFVQPHPVIKLSGVIFQALCQLSINPEVRLWRAVAGCLFADMIAIIRLS
jgi:hypothetical protein